MKRLFARRVAVPRIGGATLAARMTGVVPLGCIGVAVDGAGHTRRFKEGARMALAAREVGWCFHPGPYDLVLTPFLAAPEMGLQLRVVVDRPDPLAQQQRFDLYLASEGEESVSLALFQGAVDSALQRELAQGNLLLPPCTLADEWNAFRSGLNELLYMRFGVTVDECIPVDLAGQVDYAALLGARAVAGAPLQVNLAAPLTAPVVIAPTLSDAAALRRLFLELPPLTSRLRQLDPPAGAFSRQRALLARMDLASASALTMPALALAAPGQPLAQSLQQQRAHGAMRATSALDEMWALLARAGGALDGTLLDELERIAANLEEGLSRRRAVPMENAGVDQ